jgi:UDP-glucose 4-epimerase
VIKLVCESAGRVDVVGDEVARRSGDPAFLCADVSLIRVEIRSNSKFSLEVSIESLY